MRQQQPCYDQDYEEKESLIEDIESIEEGLTKRRFNDKVLREKSLKKAKTLKLKSQNSETSPRL